jgi:hypothetical protein
MTRGSEPELSVSSNNKLQSSEASSILYKAVFKSSFTHINAYDSIAHCFIIPRVAYSSVRRFSFSTRRSGDAAEAPKFQFFWDNADSASFQHHRIFVLPSIE